MRGTVLSDDPLADEVSRRLRTMLAEAAVLARAWAEARTRRAQQVIRDSEEQQRAAQRQQEAQMAIRRAEWRLPPSDELYAADPQRAARVWAEAREWSATEPEAWRSAAAWETIWQRKGIDTNELAASQQQGDMAGLLLAQMETAETQQRRQQGRVEDAHAEQGAAREDALAAGAPGTAGVAEQEYDEALSAIEQTEAAAAVESRIERHAGSEAAQLSAKSYPIAARASRPQTKARRAPSRPGAGPYRSKGR